MGKGLSSRKAALQLQTINKLRIRNPGVQQANPCVSVMSSVLSTSSLFLLHYSALLTIADCWASSKFSVEGCAAVEQQLRACMDEKVRIPSFLTSDFANSRRNRPKAARARSTTISCACSPRSPGRGSARVCSIKCLYCMGVAGIFVQYGFFSIYSAYTCLNLRTSLLPVGPTV